MQRPSASSRSLATLPLAALILIAACAGPPKSVRIATHHPEFASAMACHDRCAGAFVEPAERAECFLGCPGVAETALACDEPAKWNGVCYETRTGNTKSGAVGTFVGVVALVAVVTLGIVAARNVTDDFSGDEF